MAANNDVRTSGAPHIFGFDIAAFRLCIFEFARQREPELEALDVRHLTRRHFLAMPDAPPARIHSTPPYAIDPEPLAGSS
jgi:hypothetical protein